MLSGMPLRALPIEQHEVRPNAQQEEEMGKAPHRDQGEEIGQRKLERLVPSGSVLEFFALLGRCGFFVEDG